MDKKFKDRAWNLMWCLTLAFIPVHLLIQWQIVNDTLENRVIAAGIALVLYLLAR